LREIHLAGAFSVEDILAYNLSHRTDAAYPKIFPFWQLCPGAVIRRAGQAPASREAILVVINLDASVWSEIKDALCFFGRRILIQTEARINYEAAYEQVDEFDVFVNFDSSYASHPGFLQAYVPYLPHRPFAKRDARGLKAMKNQWVFSRSVFMDAYLLRFLPRHRKASMIATLHPQSHYQIRLEAVRRLAGQVDVYGGAWPKDLPGWRGMCGDKLAVSSRYRYALVMENQRQPGYITEKLLDAFAAGAVPIYWGAPDVASLPGADAIIPFGGDEFQVDRVIRDNADYRKRRKSLLANRKALFDVFSLDRYTAILGKALG